MGHKVHPTGIRLGIAKDWNSKWYANKADYAKYLVADLKVRDMLRKKLAQAGISKIQIERPAKTARVTIHSARPGVVIGKKGEDIEKLRKDVSDIMGVPAHINVNEVRKPEIDAQLVAESSTFLMRCAAFLSLNCRRFVARATSRPRTWSATRRAFCAEMRAPRRMALASIVISYFFASAAFLSAE